MTRLLKLELLNFVYTESLLSSSVMVYVQADGPKCEPREMQESAGGSDIEQAVLRVFGKITDLLGIPSFTVKSVVFPRKSEQDQGYRCKMVLYCPDRPDLFLGSDSCSSRSQAHAMAMAYTEALNLLLVKYHSVAEAA